MFIDEEFKEVVIMTTEVAMPFQALKKMVYHDNKIDLTEDEISGTILFYLALKYDEKRLKKALEEDDMDFLKKIISENKKNLSKNIRLYARCIPNEKTINSIMDLISKIGSYWIGVNLGILEEKDKKNGKRKNIKF